MTCSFCEIGGAFRFINQRGQLCSVEELESDCDSDPESGTSFEINPAIMVGLVLLK